MNNQDSHCRCGTDGEQVIGSLAGSGRRYLRQSFSRHTPDLAFVNSSPATRSIRHPVRGRITQEPTIFFIVRLLCMALIRQPCPGSFTFANFPDASSSAARVSISNLSAISSLHSSSW